uniref:Uncharacterized protein n=1 Tax=Arundo donax TaxID=35708 RepID=A0A0A9BC26_ARUDO
MYKSRGSVKLK